jgi:hypothetical protein
MDTLDFAIGVMLARDPTVCRPFLTSICGSVPLSIMSSLVTAFNVHLRMKHSIEKERQIEDELKRQKATHQ